MIKPIGQPTDLFGIRLEPYGWSYRDFANDKWLGLGLVIGRKLLSCVWLSCHLVLPIMQGNTSLWKMNASSTSFTPNMSLRKQQLKKKKPNKLPCCSKEHGISMFVDVSLYSFKCLSPLLSTLLPNILKAQASYLEFLRFSKYDLAAFVGSLLLSSIALFASRKVEDETCNVKCNLRKWFAWATHDRRSFSLSHQPVLLFTVKLSVVSWWFQQFIVNYIVRPKLREELLRTHHTSHTGWFVTCPNITT